MVDYMAPVYWLFLMLTGLAVMKLRRTHAATERPYRVPLLTLVPLVFAGGCAFVLWSSIVYVAGPDVR